MKTFLAGLQAAYESDQLSLCKLWRITLGDGSVYRLAKHTADVPLGAETFVPAHVTADSAIEATNGFEAGSMELTVLLDGVVFSAADIESGRWANALVEVIEVNYKDTAAGSNQMRRGRLGQWRLTNNTCTFEARPLQAMLRQSIGRVIQASCDVDLGGSICGINLATLTDGIITGVTVGSAASRAQFTAAGLTQAAGWFRGGLVTWTSGANVATPRAEIKDFAVGGVVTLQLPMPTTIAPGDSFTIQVGCDKSEATCGAKFNNVVNFQGFKHVPGLDRLQSGK